MMKKNKTMMMIPKLYGYASGGVNTGQNQLTELLDDGNYRTFVVIGLQLDIPIFSGFQLKNQRKLPTSPHPDSLLS